MRKKLNILTMAYMLFLVLLILSANLPGHWSSIVYYLAFILPIVISLFMSGEKSDPLGYLRIDRAGVNLATPLLFPTISLVMLISYVTSLIIFAITGKTNSVDLGDSYVLALITHALIPAIFEEALFRYLPMRLIAPHSPRCAIIISSIFFGIVHMDLFSIPYALLAGFVFMAVDLATESVVPSVIIHFINNALSVSFMFIRFDYIIFLLYLLIAALTVTSVILIIKNKDEYETALIIITEKGEGVKITPQMILFVVITLAFSVINLL